MGSEVVIGVEEGGGRGRLFTPQDIQQNELKIA